MKQQARLTLDERRRLYIMNNFKMVARFMNGLTQENVSTAKQTTPVIEVVSETIAYREHMYNYIDTRVEDIDREYNYRMHKLDTNTQEDILLTPWVKGGRL